MPGRYTREGDVRRAAGAVDDMFVIARPGDEIALSFDAPALPRARRPAGTRTFLLYRRRLQQGDGHQLRQPDTVEPLPFHGMSAIRMRRTSATPTTAAHREYQTPVHTRAGRFRRSSVRSDLLWHDDSARLTWTFVTDHPR